MKLNKRHRGCVIANRSYMRAFARALFFAVLICGFAVSAKADSVITWDWTIASDGLSGSGTLVTGPASPAPLGTPSTINGTAYFVSSMSGQFSGFDVVLNVQVQSILLSGTDIRPSPFDPWYGLNFLTSDNRSWRLVHSDIGPAGVPNWMYSYSSNRWSQAQVTMLRTPEGATIMVFLLAGFVVLAVTGLLGKTQTDG